jgi:hypothetical protein
MRARMRWAPYNIHSVTINHLYRLRTGPRRRFHRCSCRRSEALHWVCGLGVLCGAAVPPSSERAERDRGGKLQLRLPPRHAARARGGSLRVPSQMGSVRGRDVYTGVTRCGSMCICSVAGRLEGGPSPATYAGPACGRRGRVTG